MKSRRKTTSKQELIYNYIHFEEQWQTPRNKSSIETFFTFIFKSNNCKSTVHANQWRRHLIGDQSVIGATNLPRLIKNGCKYETQKIAASPSSHQAVSHCSVTLLKKVTVVSSKQTLAQILSGSACFPSEMFTGCSFSLCRTFDVYSYVRSTFRCLTSRFL